MKHNTYRTVFVALLAAMVYACTLIQIPLFASRVHLGNAVSILAGLLLSPLDAGLAAGLGSALYDATLGGYDALGCGITFVSKFLMAFVCAALMRAVRKRAGIGNPGKMGLTYLVCAVSAVTYVALYMLKTFAMKQLVDGLSLAAVELVMLEKLPASLINALFATLAAPPIYAALRPALIKAGILAKMRGTAEE